LKHERAQVYEGFRQPKHSAELLEKLLRTKRTANNPPDPKHLILQHKLGRPYIEIEQYEKAAELLEEVVQIEWKTHPTNMERLASQHILAIAYMGLGQYGKAAELLEEVLQILLQILELDHAYILVSESRLSRCRSMLGNEPNDQPSVSENVPQGPSKSDHTWQIVGKGTLDNPSMHSVSGVSSQDIPESTILPTTAPRPKKRDIFLGFLRRKRR
jgi:tetratricopeptide (TPR) repeat protein